MAGTKKLTTLTAGLALLVVLAGCRGYRGPRQLYDNPVNRPAEEGKLRRASFDFGSASMRPRLTRWYCVSDTATRSMPSVSTPV